MVSIRHQKLLSAGLVGLVALVVTQAVSSGPASTGMPTAQGGLVNGAIFFWGPQARMAINADGSGLVKLRYPGLISPDGTKVIVGETDIVDLDGGGRRRVFGDGEAYDLAWSPDAESIAYRARQGDGYVLYRFDLPTGRKTKLTDGPDDLAPAWSPDGRSIAFTRETSLYVMNAEGSNQRKLADNADWTNFAAAGAWAPDGRRIAFSASEDDSLDIVDADGANRRTLVADVSTPEFAWAPDGSKLAFSGLVGDREAAFVIDPNGSARTRIADGKQMSAPAWSPDGTKIALSFGDPADVWVMKADGTSKKRLTQALRFGGENDDPQWDPLGRRTSQLPGSPASPAGSSESRGGPRSLRAKFPISAIAADGLHVAYVLDNPCQEVESWSPGRRVTVFQAETFDCTSGGGGGIRDVAMAGSRLAWIAWQQTNHLYTEVWVATVGRPNPNSVHSEDDVEIDRLEGDGTAIVFTTDPGSTVLWRVAGNRALKIATRANIRGIALAGGSIAVWNRGRVEVLTLDGGRRLEKEHRNVAGVALTERNLAVLSEGNLDVYETRRGRRLRSWPLRGWRLADAYGDLAVLARPGDVQVIRLSDGRRRTFATPNASIPLADLERPGLFYSYNLQRGAYRGRILFIAMRNLL
jgi:dipeptidyl aminopeptidase/acylaminoacyl peptidase